MSSLTTSPVLSLINFDDASAPPLRVDVRFIWVVFFGAGAALAFFALAAAGPRGKRGVSGSHAPQPFLDHLHLLHPFETSTKAIELSTSSSAFFEAFVFAFELFAVFVVVFLAFLAASPLGRRGVSGSHAPQPFCAHLHLLQPLVETTTSAMELSTSFAADFLVFVVFFVASFFALAAAGPRGKRGVSGSHAPQPFLDHRHLLHPFVDTRAKAMELSQASAARVDLRIGGGQSFTFGGRPRRFFCGCGVTCSFGVTLTSSARSGERACSTTVFVA